MRWFEGHACGLSQTQIQTLKALPIFCGVLEAGTSSTLQPCLDLLGQRWLAPDGMEPRLLAPQFIVSEAPEESALLTQRLGVIPVSEEEFFEHSVLGRC